jgi:hypothetical protein
VFPTDLSDPHAEQYLVKRVTDQLGPVTAIHWNAYVHLAGDVIAADATALRTVFEVSVTSLNRPRNARGSEGREGRGAGHERGRA